MHSYSSLTLISLSLCGALSLSACRFVDDPESTAGTATAGTTAGTATAGTATAGTTTAGTTTAGTTTAGTTAGTTTAGTTTAGTTTAGTATAGATAGTELTYPEVSDCAELNDPSATACFANADCPEDRRCQDVGPSDYPTPCCVPGVRGVVEAGGECDPATGERECTSALCLSSDTLPTALCSGVCATDADCPTSLPRCLSIAFSGTELMFCSPAAP